MNKIWKNEARNGGLNNAESGVETTLALLSTIIDLAMREYDSLKVKPSDESQIPEEKEPPSPNTKKESEAKDKSNSKKVSVQKDKGTGTSAKNK